MKGAWQGKSYIARGFGGYLGVVARVPVIPVIPVHGIRGVSGIRVFPEYLKIRIPPCDICRIYEVWKCNGARKHSIILAG